jgi:hypothetical protein
VEIVEEWKPIVGFEGLYDISSFGRVRSHDRMVKHRWGGPAIRRGKIRALNLDKDGYALVNLSVFGKVTTCKVHRIVAEHFLPKSTLPEINHKDLNKSNNDFRNLEWASHQWNMAHAKANGKFAGRKWSPGRQERARMMRQDAPGCARTHE